MLEESYSNKDTICMNVMYITVKPPYNEVLGLTNYLLLTPLIIEYKAQYEKKPRYKLTSLVITKIFCQSLGPLLYPGCTVLNFIYLFFKKWGGGAVRLCPPPQPLHLRRPCSICAMKILAKETAVFDPIAIPCVCR